MDTLHRSRWRTGDRRRIVAETKRGKGGQLFG
jgi:hypothetical protein